MPCADVCRTRTTGTTPNIFPSRQRVRLERHKGDIKAEFYRLARTIFTLQFDRHYPEASSWRWWRGDWTCIKDQCPNTQRSTVNGWFKFFFSDDFQHPTWKIPLLTVRLDLARPIEEINSALQPIFELIFLFGSAK